MQATPWSDEEPCCASCASAAADESDGRFEGYASLFNLRDRSGDVVRPGAFRRTLAGRKPGDVRLLHQHKAEEPIGIWEEIREDGRGLLVRGRLILDSPRAKEIWALMREGAIDGLSIGYKTVRAGKTTSPKGRNLFDIDLWEISLVTFPLLPGARVTRLGAGPREMDGSGVTLTTALRDAARQMSV